MANCALLALRAVALFMCPPRDFAKEEAADCGLRPCLCCVPPSAPPLFPPRLAADRSCLPVSPDGASILNGRRLAAAPRLLPNSIPPSPNPCLGALVARLRPFDPVRRPIAMPWLSSLESPSRPWPFDFTFALRVYTEAAPPLWPGEVARSSLRLPPACGPTDITGSLDATVVPLAAPAPLAAGCFGWLSVVPRPPTPADLDLSLAVLLLLYVVGDTLLMAGFRSGGCV